MPADLSFELPTMGIAAPRRGQRFIVSIPAPRCFRVVEVLSPRALSFQPQLKSPCPPAIPSPATPSDCAADQTGASSEPSHRPDSNMGAMRLRSNFSFYYQSPGKTAANPSVCGVAAFRLGRPVIRRIAARLSNGCRAVGRIPTLVIVSAVRKAGGWRKWSPPARDPVKLMGSGRRTRRNQNEWLMPKSMPVVPPPPMGEPVPCPAPIRAGRGGRSGRLSRNG